MKNLLKENIVLIAGISLPLLLTLVFFASTQIGQIAVNDPKHKLIFVTNYYKYNNNGYRLKVKDNKIHFKYTPLDKENRYYHDKIPLLYVYDPLTGKATEIVLPVSDNKKEKTNIILNNSELNFKIISKKQESPDGYNFKSNFYRNRNIMTEIFGGGGYSRKYDYYLYKDSRKIKIPKAYGYNTKFIGWGINE